MNKIRTMLAIAPILALMAGCEPNPNPDPWDIVKNSSGRYSYVDESGYINHYTTYESYQQAAEARDFARKNFGPWAKSEAPPQPDPRIEFLSQFIAITEAIRAELQEQNAKINRLAETQQRILDAMKPKPVEPWLYTYPMITNIIWTNGMSNSVLDLKGL